MVKSFPTSRTFVNAETVFETTWNGPEYLLPSRDHSLHSGKRHCYGRNKLFTVNSLFDSRSNTRANTHTHKILWTMYNNTTSYTSINLTTTLARCKKYTLAIKTWTYNIIIKYFIMYSYYYYMVIVEPLDWCRYTNIFFMPSVILL